MKGQFGYRFEVMVAQLLVATLLLHQFGITFAIATGSISAPVELLTKKDSCVISNGIVSVTLSIPSGMVTKISYNGIDNLLEEKNNKENNRGYWNILSNTREDRLSGTTYNVVVKNENQIEISITRMYNPSSNRDAPINVDKRFVMLRGSSGFYTYTVLERKVGFPAMEIGEARVVFKLDTNMSYFMAMSDERQREMPTSMDRLKGRKLEYPEAYQLVKPSNREFDGEVDDKYFYSCDNKDNKVYGWVRLSDNPVGFWMITPSNEFRTGGPFKQDLTSHVGPTILNMFVSSHYTGKDLTIKFGNGEAWKKVLGPVFVYLNANRVAKNNPSLLWKDAKQKMLEETQNWPYKFPESTDFVKSDKRGIVKGCLLVFDRHVNKENKAAAFAYVGLARQGEAGSWQRENKGYQFWVQADCNGNFAIKNVIPGTYNLYASVLGIIGDFKHVSDVVVTPGSNTNMDDLVFKPRRNGPTLWEIGLPDRTAAEFYIPEPQPVFKVHKYPNEQDRFREYGLWRRYTDLYPVKDLVFTVGTSKYSKDWFYAHVPRLVNNETYVSTTWRILFDLPFLKSGGNYTLQLALASARVAELQVRLNDEYTVNPHFTTGLIGNDNAVARHGIHGLYWVYSIDVGSNMLVKGRNTFFLKQVRGSDIFNNVMYDYIRFEAPE